MGFRWFLNIVSLKFSICEYCSSADFIFYFSNFGLYCSFLGLVPVLGCILGFLVVCWDSDLRCSGLSRFRGRLSLLV